MISGALTIGNASIAFMVGMTASALNKLCPGCAPDLVTA
jgi:hypothetical protein